VCSGDCLVGNGLRFLGSLSQYMVHGMDLTTQHTCAEGSAPSAPGRPPSDAFAGVGAGLFVSQKPLWGHLEVQGGLDPRGQTCLTIGGLRGRLWCSRHLWGQWATRCMDACVRVDVLQQCTTHAYGATWCRQQYDSTSFSPSQSPSHEAYVGAQGPTLLALFLPNWEGSSGATRLVFHVGCLCASVACMRTCC
jgi:hypothetical protein